jgi:hypothetical protein
MRFFFSLVLIYGFVGFWFLKMFVSFLFFLFFEGETFGIWLFLFLFLLLLFFLGSKSVFDL